MGAAQAGSLNTKGFSSAVSSGAIPSSDHITYAGSFNQTYFRVGERTNKDLDLFCGVSVSNCPIKTGHLTSKNQFLGLFLKSRKDGQPRTQPIHAVLVLDVSGSMSGCLSKTKSTGQTRLQLAREAIKMFYRKLIPDDIFSLVTFQSTSQTIIPSEYVKNMDEASVMALVDKNFKQGGTQLLAGFMEAEKNFLDFKYTADKSIYERRIIMLTDVCDNSMETTDKFVDRLATSQIHCTVVGISDEFKSSTCQKLVKIKGFNYFCATEDQDLRTYLVDHFDYTFFVAAYKVEIVLESQNVQTIEVYGTPDSQQIGSYGNPAIKNKTSFTITKMQSSFPSEFVKDTQGFDVTQGGLILVRIIPKDPIQQKFTCRLRLRYNCVNGEPIQQFYNIDFHLQMQQFHSSDTMVQATRLFYYTYCIKEVLDNMNNKEKKLNDINKGRYLDDLLVIKDLAPENKKKEIDDLTKVVEKFRGGYVVNY